MASPVLDKLLQEINGETPFKFNTHQCRFLRNRCWIVGEYVQLWRGCTQLPPPPLLAMEELACVLEQALELLQQSRSEDWLHHAAVRLNNSRAFGRICFSLSKLTSLVNSQMILSAGDLKSKEVQSLLAMPQRYSTFEDFESAVEALNTSLEVDKLELVLKTRSTNQSSELAQYLLQKVKAAAKGELPVIEPLELKEMLGGGAFGMVYRAEWLGIPVAVKEFREGDNSFEKELKILKMLMLEPDPNVLQIIGYYQKDEKAYLVMELMETDLAKVIRKFQGSLRLMDMVEVMLQVASGMLYFHERNVVHRDLKPSNILVVTSKKDQFPTCFSIRLTDFGFSKTDFVSFAPDLSYQRGTIYYMAPEMLRGQKYSREVDVYSFGITCFQLLTGGLPFQNGVRKSVVADRLIEMIEAGSRPDLPLDCPNELVVLINRCWNTNAKDRPNFQTITRILSTLKDKLLIGQVRRAEPKNPNEHSTVQEFAAVATDLIGKISICKVSVNFLQCSFLQSRCMQISRYLGYWNELELPSSVMALRKLVIALRSALSLVETYSKESWLRAAVTKLHNPLSFKMIVEELNSSASLLNSEAAKMYSGADELQKIASQESQGMTMERLAQYAEDDKIAMIHTARELISASQATSGSTDLKLLEYLVKKVDGARIPHIEPQEIVLEAMCGMTANGAIFKANWLGLTVALKSLSGAEKVFKQFDRRHAHLETYHPNILPVLGYTKHGEDYFLVIEFATGRLLRTRGQPLPPVFAVEALYQLAQGIQYLHDHNLEHGDVHVIFLEFEKSESEGFTGNITVKVSTTSSSKDSKRRNLLGVTVENLKETDVYKFGAACFEFLTGNTIEAEVLLSEKLPQLPPDCPRSLQLMIQKCSSSSPPTFKQIITMLQSAKLELECNATSTDYRKMLLEMQQGKLFLEANQGEELELMGHAIVGEKLIVVGNMERGASRLYQWVRQHRDGTIERLQPFLVTESDFRSLDYTLTANDFNKGLSLTYVNMNERIELAGRETTTIRWVSSSDSMKRAIKNAWDEGKASFKVQIQEINKTGYLVIKKTQYLVKWTHYLRPVKVKTPFSSTSFIKFSDHAPDICQLVTSNAPSWHVSFKDPSTRDLAVLTFRHFTKMHSLYRRISSRRISV